ncbi:MAG: serine/threonine protein kinase [Deltaproteobacteria bacterium]|nr:serine/threonine protein kinase [Deltaproteobacteria bacterium]
MLSEEARARPLLTSRYELLMSLASGGMATVYVGMQRGAGGFQRIVAIKRLHAHIVQNEEMAAMFRDEAQIASLIQHPNVVAIHDVYMEAGEQLLVMEYVDGVSLGQLRKALNAQNLAIPRKVAMRIVVEALRGLHAAHELKDLDGAPLHVIHRDATPHNLLVAADGCVKVTDFGIARAAERSSATQTGQVKGKYAYMAPEQVAGREIDRRVDVFAMGVVLWEALANRTLFRGENEAQIISQITSGTYQKPSELRGDVPKALDAIVMKAISVSASGRFDTASDFADALESFARTTLGLGSQADVAKTVTTGCADMIQARRHQVHEILGGRMPKVSWGAPRMAPGTGSSYASAPSVQGAVTPDSVVLDAPPPTMSPVAAMLRRNVAWVAAGSVSAAILVIILAFTLGGSSSKTQAASSASAPVAPASQTPSAAIPAEASTRVTVRIEADSEIVELRVPEGGDVEIVGKTATFTTPRGDKPIAIHMRFDDGTGLDETVLPNANSFIRVRKTAAGTKALQPVAPEALPLVGSKGGGKTQPGGAPTAQPTNGKGPALKYENNPYE